MSVKTLKRNLAFFLALLALPSARAEKSAQTDPVEALNKLVRHETARTKPIRYIFYSGIRYVLLFDVADFYGLASQYTKQGVVLYSATRRVEMFYEKREGSINGTKTFFLEPVLYLNKRPYITESDFLRVIDPALRTRIPQKHTIRTIMIDPGHGGSDPGAKGPVLSEKQVNLMIAIKLRRALEKLGFRVLMTRTGDTFPTLKDRTDLAKKHKPDLFISIHCNSAANSAVYGIETFLVTPAGACSTADKTPQSTQFSGNAFDQNNYRLAFDVHRSLLKFTGCEDRGVRHARFYVLRNSVCPSILIECGFLSNNSEGRLLASNERQNKIVAGILSGLARYAEAVKPPPKDSAGAKKAEGTGTAGTARPAASKGKTSGR